MSWWNSILLLVAALAATVDAFYVPGVRPIGFKKGDEVELKVNAMTSIHTQIPKDYYRLPFCQPAGGPGMDSQNLGEFLTGNKIQSSPYSIHMLIESYCKKLCQVEITKADAARFRFHVRHRYHNNWIIDNLPSAAIGINTNTGKRQAHYAGGFPIGFMPKPTVKELKEIKKRKDRKAHLDSIEAYIFNHVNIFVDYHQYDPDKEEYRVVWFAVEPISVKHHFQGGYEWDGTDKEGWTKEIQGCSAAPKHMDRNDITEYQIIKEGEKIIFTYDVIWRESDVPWSSRWDIYLTEDYLVPPQVHWYSITNSIVVVIFLSILVISVLVRNLRRDITAYNALAALADVEKDEDMDESGWRSVHADVFRPPDNYPMFFCVCCGGGVQIGLTVLLSICFSAIGFLNPARRGSLMNGIISFYVLSGIFAGYVSSRLYKSFEGHRGQVCTVVTALLFPGIAFSMFVFFNIILSFLHSTAAVPFFYIITLAAIWCGVSVPLVFVGAYFGNKKESIEYPTITSTIARAIPPPRPLFHPLGAQILAGAVPFATAYVELFFILTSLWMDQYYYVFGFTLIVYFILIITCAEVTLLLVYIQLCAENHRWWWFSFFAPGSTALYTFLYSILWFGSLDQEDSDMITTYLLYFGYMGLICSAMFLVTGTVGALSSLWFIRTIFGTIKFD